MMLILFAILAYLQATGSASINESLHGEGPTIAVENLLRCYQCTVEDNSLCTDEFLRPCPRDQAYDQCQTRIRKKEGQTLDIEKRCVLAPCAFRDRSLREHLGFDQVCDRSQLDYDCTVCCKGDGCNKDLAASHGPIFTFWLLAFHFGLRALGVLQ